MAEVISKSTYLGGSGLSLNPSLPLAEQVADYYRSMITNGELHFGDELPPAKNFEGVSHVTVLNAYRKLADEGYIHLQRAKRTRVAKNFECQRYIILAQYRNHTLYEDALFSECQQVALYKGRSPDVFYLGGKEIETLSEAEALIPNYLRDMVDKGHVRAVIFHKPDHIPGVLEWVERKSIPHVSLSPFKNISHVYSDSFGTYGDGIRLLAEKGCRNISILPWHWLKIPSQIKAMQKEFPGVRWVKPGDFGFVQNYPINCGRDFVSECCRKGKNIPDALIVMDDIAGLGALLELKERGLRVPQDIRLLVSSHKSQILPAFKGCDLIVTPIEDFVMDAVRLVEDVISGKEAAGTSRAIPYTIASAEETQDTKHLM